MPQLVVRNIEETVVRKLRTRAAREGVSMEEEHRRILREALIGRKKRGATFADYLISIPQASENEPSDLFERKRDMPREIDL
jgi:plasmid stability protein